MILVPLLEFNAFNGPKGFKQLATVHNIITSQICQKIEEKKKSYVFLLYKDCTNSNLVLILFIPSLK